MCNRNGQSFITGIVLGGIVGAILGILYAPKPGEETRKELKKRAEEWKKQGLKAADEFSKKAKVQTVKYKKRAEQAVKVLKGEE